MAAISAEEAITMTFDTVHLKRRPLPIAPDGYYDEELSNDPAAQRKRHSVVTNIINKITTFGSKGGFKPDLKLVSAFYDIWKHPEAVNDRLGAVGENPS
ncbi:hypothetical protein ONZ45_g9410 [Pleurotus djamor]|nr:hypothetical protein ONZ45_g9410 [Pleurotus djamor]